jgi:hypothetical protein
VSKTALAKSTALPGFKIKRAVLKGLSGIVFHNSDRADLLDPITRLHDDIKKTTKRKERTLKYYEKLAKLEYLGSLYTNTSFEIVQDEEGNVAGVNGDAYLVIPGRCVVSMLMEGLGAKKDARLGLICHQFYPILISGKLLSVKETFERYVEFVKPSKSRNSRMQWVTSKKALFPEWELEIEFQYRTKLFDDDKIDACLNKGLDSLGLGAERSQGYGRFEIVNGMKG